MAENEWMIECVTQYLRSPLWTVPLHNFIDEHCVFFADYESQQSALQGAISCDLYLIHKRFCELIDGLVTNFITELGVEPGDLVKTCQNSANPDAAKFFEYILALDDFSSFKQIMVKRNLELEQQAMAALARNTAASLNKEDGGAGDSGGGDGSPARSDGGSLDNEDEDLKRALLESLQDEMRRTGVVMEDEELKKALALSLAADEQRTLREQMEQAELEAALQESRAFAEKQAQEAQAQQDASKAAEAQLRAEENQVKEQQAIANAQRIEQEKRDAEARKQQMEQEVAARRAELARQAAEQERLAEEQKKLQQRAQEEEAQRRRQQQQQQEQQAQQAKPAPLVVRHGDSGDQQQPATGPGGLAPIQRGGGGPALAPLGGGPRPFAGGALGFNTFSKLGDIPARQQGQQPQNMAPVPVKDNLASQPTFSQLVENAKQEKGEQPSAPRPGPNEEDAKKFAEYMRKQRDAILKANKAQRSEEMNHYKEAQGVAPSSSAPSDDKKTSAVDEEHAKLSQDLARRMRAGLGGQ